MAGADMTSGVFRLLKGSVQAASELRKTAATIRQRGFALCVPLFMTALTLLSSALMADGPADNNIKTVRRIPKPGIAVPPEREAAIRKQLQALQEKLNGLQTSKDLNVQALLPDVMIFERAVRCALDYNEFFDAKDLDKADELLAEGLKRARQLEAGQPEWPSQKGLVVRGYFSRIDHSVQPYGLIVPETYDMDHSVPVRCDIWFHGRGETLSEVNFIFDRMKSMGQFAPAHTIVLHPYGRYCNAFKFAGEIDVLEGLDDTQRRYRIDEDRISVRGFSMGGAACWQFAVHYPDRWFAATPGAGFSETPEFLKVFQKETLNPTPWEKALWNLYDCDKYAVNLAHCPTIAYSGEQDQQKQAADVMEAALLKEGIRLRHIIGPKMGHKYDDESKRIIEEGMASLAASAHRRAPDRLQFTTHTLRYNRMHWVTVDGMDQHWTPARVEAEIERHEQKSSNASGTSVISLKLQGVSAITLDFPSGTWPVTQFAKFPPSSVTVKVKSGDGAAGADEIVAEGPLSDGSLTIHAHRDSSGHWVSGRAPNGLRKRHGLQGPVDDAFMDSFVFVRPSGKSSSAKVQAWVESEMARAVEQWRRHFRGDVRIVSESEVSEQLIQSASLVLWGDAESSALIAKIADQIPVKWMEGSIRAEGKSFDSASHVPVMIYPNPLNPNRYVVLNSGFTFREFASLNNARQVPMLPDWAIISLDTPPDSVWPGKVVAADFFDEQWQFKKLSP